MLPKERSSNLIKDQKHRKRMHHNLDIKSFQKVLGPVDRRLAKRRANTAVCCIAQYVASTSWFFKCVALKIVLRTNAVVQRI